MPAAAASIEAASAVFSAAPHVTVIDQLLSVPVFLFLLSMTSSFHVPLRALPASAPKFPVAVPSEAIVSAIRDDDVTEIDGERVRLAADLRANLAAADRFFGERFRDAIDAFIAAACLDCPPAEPAEVVAFEPPETASLDLARAGIGTILWTTGYRQDLGWIEAPVTDDLGFADCVDPDVAAICARAARAFRELGCRVEEVTPRWPSPFEPWLDIFCGGIATRLAPYLERRAEIDAGLVRIIESTLRNPPTKYVQAWFDRLAWWQHPRAFFEKYDLLLTPTIACPPFTVGFDNPTEIAGKPVRDYAWIPFTYPFNLTGQPAATVPCGFTGEGLPIGLQIVGPRHRDTHVPAVVHHPDALRLVGRRLRHRQREERQHDENHRHHAAILAQ